ncbi:MAG: cation transporter [Crenarchaeota archaeon]|nr:cation transporter [Thermoproteota archaeon]
MRDRDQVWAERVEGIVGILISLVVWFIRYIVSVSTRSVAVFVDALHALIDASTSGIVLGMSFLAEKPADEEHPYGHGRAVALGSNIIGMIVAGIGAWMIYEAFMRYISGTYPVLRELLPLAPLMLLTAFIKLGQWLFARYLGVRYGSRLCLADAKHHLADAVMTGAVVASMYAIYFTKIFVIDIIIAIGIGTFIVKEGIKIMKESSSILLDRCVRPLAREVEKIARSVRGVKDVRRVRVRDFGRYYVAELDIVVDKNMTLEEAHKLAHEVENIIMRRIPEIKQVHTHFAPEDSVREGTNMKQSVPHQS